MKTLPIAKVSRWLVLIIMLAGVAYLLQQFGFWTWVLTILSSVWEAMAEFGHKLAYDEFPEVMAWIGTPFLGGFVMAVLALVTTGNTDREALWHLLFWLTSASLLALLGYFWHPFVGDLSWTSFLGVSLALAWAIFGSIGYVVGVFGALGFVLRLIPRMDDAETNFLGPR